MPTYEYECVNKHRFEKRQAIKDEPIRTCPECGTVVRRVLHPAGIIFKGSGWYKTDSRPAGSDSKPETATKPETKTDGGEPKTESAGEAKSDSRSEAKSPKSEAKGESKSDSKGDSPAKSSSSGSGDSKAGSPSY